MGVKAKTKSPKKTCDCIKQIDGLLAEHNTQLDLMFMMNGTAMMQLAVMKVDSKKRIGPKRVVVAYCPICGRKL